MSPTSEQDQEFVVLGAGVIGLTTALTLRSTFPSSKITIVAKHLPGDSSIEYTSPWAGANWQSFEADDGPVANYDRVTFHRFSELVDQGKGNETGLKRMGVRVVFDGPAEGTGVFNKEGKAWYEELVGGVEEVEKSELPEGAERGVEFKSTFVINIQIYLAWLQTQCLTNNITFIRRPYTHIDDIPADFPNLTALFNCTALGSYSLGGVQDHSLYPTRGQTVIIAEPKVPLQRMYGRVTKNRSESNRTYVFPRPLGGGVVLGGCMQVGNWDPEPDMELAEGIIKRCCELVPELGKPEEVKIIGHRVGLRPSRKDGVRVELEHRGTNVVVHNYGHSGAGYQSSWGTAAKAIELAKKAITARPKL